MASHGLCGDQHIVNTGISSACPPPPASWHLASESGDGRMCPLATAPRLTTPALSHRKCRTQLYRQMPNLANFALQNVK